MSKYNTTIDFYRKRMLMYGTITVIYLCEYFEEREEYEECDKIIHAVRQQSDLLNIDLPTKLNDEFIKEVKKLYLSHGFSENTLLNNSSRYANEILREIELTLKEKI